MVTWQESEGIKSEGRIGRQTRMSRTEYNVMVEPRIEAKKRALGIQVTQRYMKESGWRITEVIAHPLMQEIDRSKAS